MFVFFSGLCLFFSVGYVCLFQWVMLRKGAMVWPIQSPNIGRKKEESDVTEAVRASSSRYRWHDINHQSASTNNHGT